MECSTDKGFSLKIIYGLFGLFFPVINPYSFENNLF